MDVWTREWTEEGEDKQYFLKVFSNTLLKLQKLRIKTQQTRYSKNFTPKHISVKTKDARNLTHRQGEMKVEYLTDYTPT